MHEEEDTCIPCTLHTHVCVYVYTCIHIYNICILCIYIHICEYLGTDVLSTCIHIFEYICTRKSIPFTSCGRVKHRFRV
jgi:hypothetical protein